MLDIEYSLIIETTEEPDFFTFFLRISTDLPEWDIRSKTAYITRGTRCAIT